MAIRNVQRCHIFHQGDKTRLPESINASCMPTSACAAAHAKTSGVFSAGIMNRLLVDGFALYMSLKNAGITHLQTGFLFADNLPNDFSFLGKRVFILDRSECPGGLLTTEYTSTDYTEMLVRFYGKNIAKLIPHKLII